MVERKSKESFFENRKSDLMSFFLVMLALIDLLMIDNYKS